MYEPRFPKRKSIVTWNKIINEMKRIKNKLVVIVIWILNFNLPKYSNILQRRNIYRIQNIYIEPAGKGREGPLKYSVIITDIVNQM